MVLAKVVYIFVLTTDYVRHDIFEDAEPSTDLALIANSVAAAQIEANTFQTKETSVQQKLENLIIGPQRVSNAVKSGQKSPDLSLAYADSESWDGTRY